ncbi:suppressor of cytokine signaling 7-like isoform X2 [Brachyhypopomus gauderio]|uniref:suppressor of cytokine signaling 7-like isoform X2 n=1 Tax=Brachyhypopomus gauderio TaxID=698409 RepID=UPI004042F2BD
MTNARDASPDFVLMRFVSAAQYDRLDDENLLSGGGAISGFGKTVLGHHRHNIANGFEFDQGDPTAGPDTAALSGSQQDGGPGTPDGAATSHAPPPPEFPVFPHGAAKGSRAQLMVFQNLLRPGDRVLECGLEQPGFQVRESDKQDVGGVGLAHGAAGDATNYGADAQQRRAMRRFAWNPVLKLGTVEVNEGQDGLCQRHRLISDTLEWPPLGDKTLHFGTTDAHKPSSATDPRVQDPVLTLARRLGELGQGSDVLRKDGDIPLCSCQSVLTSAGAHPGEDPSETSDALLVLEGLGTEEVGELSPAVCQGDGLKCGPVAQAFGQQGGAGNSLGGLMRQVHRFTEEDCCNPRPGLAASEPGGPAPRPLADPSTHPQDAPGASAPLSRPPTPKHVGSPMALAACGGPDAHRAGRAKSRKGSFKVCLSKLFRTKSSGSSSSVGHGTDKRPSLTSSTSSGGSLLDVWGSSSLETDPGSRPQHARPQSAYSPVPFTDDFGGPPPAASLQSLPLRPPPPAHSAMQHSLSLNDTFLRGVPRPGQVLPDGQSAVQEQRPLLCPLSRPDASSFATSLRELEKCGWYWGPMNWEDAEMKLKGKPDGSFLVRDSSDPRYILSLSFRSQGITHHTRMEHYRGTFSLWCHPKFEDRCHSVVEFIERAIMHSKNGRFLYFLRSRVPGLPPTPVQLLYPVSRFSSVKSLQHLCRFCIRQLVRVDHIQELPLPTPLILYLRKFYFYDPEEEKYLSIRELGRDSGATQDAEPQT